MDNLSTGRLSRLGAHASEVDFIQGDVRDPLACQEAVRGVSGVFHEAALVSVFDSINDPALNHAINVNGMFNILEAARLEGVKRFVFASSAAVYGDLLVCPKHELMLPCPSSPYAVAKITAEHYMRSYAELYEMQCVALRYFNVYGAGQDSSSMYSGVISKFLSHLKKGTQPTIHGDGMQSRDFVHVSDIVAANLLAMSVPLAEDFCAFNIATGRETSLLQLIDAINQITGANLKPNFEDWRTGDIRRSFASIDLARRFLGYEPQVMNVSQGLAQILDASPSLAPVLHGSQSLAQV
jgi:UDP-glucose 4-epimerase